MLDQPCWLEDSDGGMSCALCGVEQYLWSPPPRCQEAPNMTTKTAPRQGPTSPGGGGCSRITPVGATALTSQNPASWRQHLCDHICSVSQCWDPNRLSPVGSRDLVKVLASFGWVSCLKRWYRVGSPPAWEFSGSLILISWDSKPI